MTSRHTGQPRRAVTSVPTHVAQKCKQCNDDVLILHAERTALRATHTMRAELQEPTSERFYLSVIPSHDCCPRVVCLPGLTSAAFRTHTGIPSEPKLSHGHEDVICHCQSAWISRSVMWALMHASYRCRFIKTNFVHALCRAPLSTCARESQQEQKISRSFTETLMSPAPCTCA